MKLRKVKGIGEGWMREAENLFWERARLVYSQPAQRATEVTYADYVTKKPCRRQAIHDDCSSRTACLRVASGGLVTRQRN
jgi:hypothetical protein